MAKNYYGKSGFPTYSHARVPPVLGVTLEPLKKAERKHKTD